MSDESEKGSLFQAFFGVRSPLLCVGLAFHVI